MESEVRRNQFGEEVIGSCDTNPKKWTEVWDQGKTLFHMPVVHPMLQKYYDAAFEGKETSMRCFVPLCGKSLDIKWLAEKGHTVIGNEVVELGCTQFFTENGIPYEASSIEGIPGKMFKSQDKALNITLYCCDFFQLTRELIGGCVDAIWDRGSLVAINLDERTRYSDVITSLMGPQTSYLLDTFRVDHTVFAGPPNDVSEEEINRLFSGACHVTWLGERDAITDRQRAWGLTSFIEHAHLLKLKQN